MKLLNINIEFSGRNDLLFEGKKISGNAFLQNKYGMLMHGTFLYDCDLETMVRAISPSDEKLISKGIDSVRSRVTNLKPYLNGLTQNQLIKHFENTLTNQTYELSEEEITKIKLLANKYESRDWIYKKQPLYTKVLKKRIAGGLFEVKLDLDDSIIKNIAIQGDFFDTRPLVNFEKAFIDIPYDRTHIHDILEHHHIESYILDSKTEEFKILLFEGILGE
jgi:lipoate-protein ligase A